MKKILLQVFPWLLLLIVAVMGYQLAAYLQTDSGLADVSKIKVSPECGFNSEACEVLLDDVRHSISVSGDVTPLRPFLIHLQGGAINSAVVSFSMQDMDMGINRFSFQKTDNAHWEAQVMLPICTVSRKDWIAEFFINNEDGKSYVVEYAFNSD